MPLRADLIVPKAIDGVIVDHPDGLHEGVADGRAGEAEASAFEVFAHGVGLGGFGRDLFDRFPRVAFRLAVDELPDVRIEAGELIANGQVGLGVVVARSGGKSILR